MSEASENFEGFLSGRVYDIIARLTGYGPDYYRRAALAVPVRPGMKIIDLGCGTASLSLQLAKRMEGRGTIVGIDVSAGQLERAREKVQTSGLPIELRQASSQELEFDDDSVDGICMSQVLHAFPDDLRQKTLTESSRVLKPGGFFALIDWSRPRIGYAAAVWTVSLLGARDSHNWRGTYPELFKSFGLQLATDTYLDSLNRCQVFVK